MSCFNFDMKLLRPNLEAIQTNHIIMTTGVYATGETNFY